MRKGVSELTSQRVNFPGAEQTNRLCAMNGKRRWSVCWSMRIGCLTPWVSREQGASHLVSRACSARALDPLVMLLCHLRSQLALETNSDRDRNALRRIRLLRARARERLNEVVAWCRARRLPNEVLVRLERFRETVFARRVQQFARSSLPRIRDTLSGHDDVPFVLKLLNKRGQLLLWKFVLVKRIDRASELCECARLGLSTLLEVRNNLRVPVFGRFCLCDLRRGRLGGTVRALETALLIQENLDLLFQRHATEQRVERFAAGNTVVVAVAAAVFAGHEMFNARIRTGQRLRTEEAQPALSKEQPFDGLGWHASASNAAAKVRAHFARVVLERLVMFRVHVDVPQCSQNL